MRTLEQVVVFDVDGVLADSLLLMHECVNKALEELGKSPISEETFRKNYTVRKLEELHKAYGVDHDTEGAQFQATFNHFYSKETPDSIPSRTFFEQLSEHATLYALSAGTSANITRFFNKHDLLPFFKAIYTDQRRKARVLEEIAHNHPRAQISFVGDSHDDYLCACEARENLHDATSITFLAAVHSDLFGKRPYHITDRAVFEGCVGRKYRQDRIIPHLGVLV